MLNVALTRQFVAELSLAGMGCDVLGGCYLAYDLLGGKRGPLRTIARATGYVALFFIGYLAVLGVRYALVAASGMGILLAIEFRRAGANPELALGFLNFTRKKSRSSIQERVITPAA